MACSAAHDIAFVANDQYFRETLQMPDGLDGYAFVHSLEVLPLPSILILTFEVPGSKSSKMSRRRRLSSSVSAFEFYELKDAFLRRAFEKKNPLEEHSMSTLKF